MTDKPKYNTFEMDVYEIAAKLKSMQARYDLQKKQLDTTNPSILPLLKYDNVKWPNWYTGMVSEWFEYPNGRSYSYTVRRSYTTVEEVINVRDKLISEIEAVLNAQNVVDTFAANQERIKHNQHVADRIETFMRVCGIPDTYRERDYKSRAREPKFDTHSAGYLGDIRRNVIRADVVYAGMKAQVDNAKASITRHAEKMVVSVRELQAATVAAEKEKRQENFIATMRVKYNLDFDASQRAVLGAILASNNTKDLEIYNELF